MSIKTKDVPIRPIPTIKTRDIPGRPIPTINVGDTEPAGKLFAVNVVRSYTLAEDRAERARAEAEYRATDVLERLRCCKPLEHKHDATIRDAITEIEWLRAARPDAVTRGELANMAAKLRQVQEALVAMLDRIEPGISSARHSE